jgi:hypothetical protein
MLVALRVGVGDETLAPIANELRHGRCCHSVAPRQNTLA